MPGAMEALVNAANACVVAPVIDGMLVPVQVEAIYINGLRQRIVHNNGNTFVEISVVGQDNTLVRTDVNPAPTAPSWKFKRAINLAVSPSSCIRFAVHRYHHVRSDELIGVVEGTAWTFLDAHYKQGYLCPAITSVDSPDMTVRVLLRIADADHKGIAQNDPAAHLDCEEVRLSALDRKHCENTGEFVRAVIMKALEYLGIICSILDTMSDFPLCKAASTFLRLVRVGLTKMLEKQQEIDEHMALLLHSLMEAVSNASRSGSDALKEEVVHLAGQCAEILDGWISHNLGAQMVHGVVGSLKEKAKKCRKRVSELNMKAEGLLDRQSNVSSESGSDYGRSPSPESQYSPMTPPSNSPLLGETKVFGGQTPQIDGSPTLTHLYEHSERFSMEKPALLAEGISATLV